MSRVLGDLIQEGCVAKIADDLYVGGNSPIEVLNNWSRVLALLQKNNLRLSAAKTIICPRKAVVLGWVWSNGTLQASPHKLAALSSVEPPSTVQGLRSFVGAYKVLSRVLPRFAELLDPLDQATAGKESRDKIVWCDELLLAFKTAQRALVDNRTITIPQPQDALWIVTDGSVKNRGISATLYVHRNGSLLLAGFFSAKLRKHQVTWLPCEIEALAIGAAIRHFAPYIIQSHTQPKYSPTANLVFRLMKSSREENSQPAQGSPPSCQQSAAILSTYVISPELRTYPPILQAVTPRNVWTLVAKFANSSSNSRIPLFAASLLVMSFKGLPRCPSLAVLPGRLPSWSVHTSGEHTRTLAKVPDPLRRPPKLLM